MKNSKKKSIEILLGIILFLCFRGSTFAAEDREMPIEVLREEPGGNVIPVTNPVMEEGEPGLFDFILDPEGLLYETDAARYGGGRVEQGAAVLFRNESGPYDFSGNSDLLTIVNDTAVPVKLTISVWIDNLGEVQLAENNAFSDNGACSLYFAVTDSQGNVRPLSAQEKTSIAVEMPSSPENAGEGESSVSTYSFGLTGACNQNADWRDVEICPRITVEWYIEPMLPEMEELPEGGGKTVSQGDAL